MLPGEFKPLLATLVLPPAGPLLLIVAGALLARWRRLAWLLAAAGTLSLWLLSTTAVSAWLAAHLLPQVNPTTPQALKAAQVQAIVVLGGGINDAAPEYGRPQPSPSTLVRLRYGAHLAQATGLPIGFAGGVGWAHAGTGVATEAEAAETALADWRLPLRWRDAQSRDTAENAQEMTALLARDGVTRIALVTHAWHLPRALQHFEAQGFIVVPAPTAFILPGRQPLLDWLPGSEGLAASRAVLREWLALQLL